MSPIKLPLQQGVQRSSDRIFDGLFGLFNDSLPDGWGKLLLDRAVVAQGVPYQSLTPLDRLAHVGAWGMGSLIYEPDHGDQQQVDELLNLDTLNTKVQEVLKGEETVEVDRLLQLGGSSAGARPKVLVGYNSDTSEIINGQQVLPTEYEHWIIKFKSIVDPPDVGRLEYAYAQMGKSCWNRYA